MTELGKIKTGSSMSFPLTSSRCHPPFRFQLLALTLMIGLATMGSSCFAFTPSSSRSVPNCRHRLSHLHLKSDGLTPEEREVKVGKAMKAMTAFTNTYLKKTETTLCQEKSIAAVVIKGLAEHKVDYGAPLCPCRFYDDKEKEVKDGYWNCPCVPMREEKVCHCMLFLTEDNAFAGDCQSITVDEVVDLSEKAK